MYYNNVGFLRQDRKYNEFTRDYIITIKRDNTNLHENNNY